MNTRRLYAASKRRRQVYLKKVMILLSIILFATGLGVVFGGNLVSAQDNMHRISKEQKFYKSIEIAQGDTLWDIAEKYMNDDYKSVQSYIKEIKEINGLLGDDIQEGQYLTVPYFNRV